MNDDEQTKIRTSQDTLNHAAQNSAPSPAIGADAQTRRPLFENYRSCLDAIPDLVALKGTDLEYLFVNRAYCDLLGKRRDDILGKRATEIFSQDVARKLEIMDLLVLAGADKSVEEVRIDNRIFEIRKFPVSIDEEGLVVTAGRDITERKSAEEDLLSKKIRFQIMSDNSPLAMALLDGDGHVDYVNTRFKEIFGYDSDEIRDGATWFRRVFPGREYEREIASILQRPQDVEGWAERERRVLTAVCRNGTQKILSLEAVQLTSGDMVVS
jgi:PAS domain S-box-containing protein